MLEQLYKTEFCAVPSVQTMDRGIVFDSVDNCGADTILGFGKPIINLPKNKNSSKESPINLRRHVVCADFLLYENHAIVAWFREALAVSNKKTPNVI